MLPSWPPALLLRRSSAFSESRPVYAALFAIYQPRWPFTEMGGHLQGLAVLSVATLRGEGRALQVCHCMRDPSQCMGYSSCTHLAALFCRKVLLGVCHRHKGTLQPACDYDALYSLQLFSEYDCPWVRRGFGLHFNQLMDTLSVFALGSGAELVLRFPGANEELICE